MNIIEYVKQFGNKSMLEEPFRDSDSLVLSQIAYYNLDLFTEKFIFNKPKKTYLLKEILNLGNKDSLLVYNSIMEKNALKFIKPLINSKRFGDLRIGYIKSILDKDKESQFFALTFFLPNGSLFIAFRGTDATLTGWKEDLNMAHLNIVPSHLKALLYVNTVLDYEDNTPFYIGGHSKGGNLAYFAAMNMHESHLKYLIKVYNHDGPGFRHPESIFNKDRELIINSKCLKTMPHRSLVGILLHHDVSSKIVKSTQLYLLQHDLFSWVIDSNTKEISYLEKRSLISKVNEKMMTSFLAELNDEELKEVADALFEMLGGAKYTVYDLASNPLSVIKRGRIIFRRYNKEKRRRLFKVVALLFKTWSIAVIYSGIEPLKK